MKPSHSFLEGDHRSGLIFSEEDIGQAFNSALTVEGLNQIDQEFYVIEITKSLMWL